MIFSGTLSSRLMSCSACIDCIDMYSTTYLLSSSPQKSHISLLHIKSFPLVLLLFYFDLRNPESLCIQIERIGSKIRTGKKPIPERLQQPSDTRQQTLQDLDDA